MRLALLFIPFLLFSCSPGGPASSAESADSVPATAAPKPGTISDFSCTGDASNLYSVYLPSNYSADKKWRTVIFFDAHGNGRLPLEKYKALADRWSCIFVGSNSSKNGMQAQDAMRTGNGLVNEVLKVLPVNPSEVMLCGFSGGARVAAGVAGGRNDIKAVLCNSAAPQDPLNGKLVVGIAGLSDMNYLELKKYAGDPHEHTNRAHQLLVFDGKHEWAPPSVFEDALLLAASWSANEQAAIDTTLTHTLAANIRAQADSIKGTSCKLAGDLLYLGAISTGDGGLVKYAGTFSGGSCYKSDQAAWKKAEEKENTMQQFLGDAVLTRDTTWWREHASEYFETKEKGAEKFMRDRLRGYVSLMCYSYSNQAFRMKNLHAAEKMTKIYSIVDPENSEWAYLRASLYMQLNMKEYVMPSLEKAVELGFSDRSRLQNDPVFVPLHNDPAFNELFGKMKP